MAHVDARGLGLDQLAKPDSSYGIRLIGEGLHKTAAILPPCQTEMRPLVMTCVEACVGLVPAAVLTGIGSQVQKPLALIVGGMLLAPILIALAVLIDRFSCRAELRGKLSLQPELAE
jgi:cobalt-zinc-cadmium resistance protein CzcA